MPKSPLSILGDLKVLWIKLSKKCSKEKKWRYNIKAKTLKLPLIIMVKSLRLNLSKRMLLILLKKLTMKLMMELKTGNH